MASSSIPPCDWLTAGELVEDIHAEKLNVTTIVFQCANVCDLAYKSERQEILGKGIMISSSIQLILFSIFGFSLPFIVWFLNKRSTAEVAPLSILLRKLRKPLLETSFFFTLSLVIAIILSYKQNPSQSILELDFISRILDFQRQFSLGLLMSNSADGTLNKTELSGHLNFLHLSIFVALLAAPGLIKISHKDIYNDLAKECRNQHQSSVVLSSALTGGESFLWVGIGLGFAVFIIASVVGVMAYQEHIADWLKRPIKAMWSKVPSWLKELVKVGFQFLFVGIYVLSVPMDFRRLQKQRDLVLQMSQPGAGEEVWSYGQSTAVLVWLPFIYCALKETIQHFFISPEPAKNETLQKESQEEKDEKLPPYQERHIFPSPYEQNQATSTGSTPAITEFFKNDTEMEGVRRTSSGR